MKNGEKVTVDFSVRMWEIQREKSHKSERKEHTLTAEPPMLRSTTLRTGGDEKLPVVPAAPSSTLSELEARVPAKKHSEKKYSEEV
eukprot:SAG31_NODE_1458_length_8257_cov_10.274209_8_plen_86_part_00